MNCKWAEGHLSECLDGTLDPTVRDEVVAHVESCENCSGILADYRYFDGLVGSLPRYEPSDDLKLRIFGSPEFAAILQGLEDQPAATRGPVVSQPIAEAQPAAEGQFAPTEPQLVARAAGSPAQLPRTGLDARRARGGAPPWLRVALPAAAAVVIMLGSALLIKQGFWHSTTPGKPSISNVGSFQSQPPLAAGTRVVFERGGALWSAPEHGVGVAQQLTPAGVQVGASWAVSPIRSNGSGGDSVAYVDLKTGSIHVVRADDQRDHVVGQQLAPKGSISAAFWSSAEGQTLLGSLAWSPDGSRLAYLTDAAGTGYTALNIVNADGSGQQAVNGASGASLSLATWSPDGQRIAFVQTAAASQSVWDYNVTQRQGRELSASAEPGGNITAVVRQLGWMAASFGPAVTWASGDATSGNITGLFADRVLQDTQPRALVQSGATFTAADFSAARNSGTWLLGDNSGLYAISAIFPGRAQLATVPDGVRSIAWSPDGTAAAYVTGGGDLHVWVRAEMPLEARSVATQPGLAWSPDSSAVAFVSGGHVGIVQMANGQIAGTAMVSGLDAPSALAWAPDGQALAVSTGSGVSLVSANGTSATPVDTHAADGALGWSVAR